MVKIFLDNLIVLVYLDNKPEIYFDYFVEVARKNDKIYNRGTCCEDGDRGCEGDSTNEVQCKFQERAENLQFTL